VLSKALSVYRRHFGALVFTCALAVVPANLIAAGAVVFGLARLGSGGVAETRTATQELSEKERELQEHPPPTADARDERASVLKREAFSRGQTTTVALPSLRGLLPIVYATAIGAVLLLVGLFIAHAAIVPLVLERRAASAGAEQACAVVGSRIGSVVATGLIAALLAALGALFFVLPGLILAVGFSLAPPIVVCQGLSGRDALERSWRLMDGHWGEALFWWLLIVAFSVLASAVAAAVPPGFWRPVSSALIRVVLYPLPLVGLVLLYRKSVSTFVGFPRPDSSARESAGSSLH
jgi:hypothetical protein